MKSFIFCLNMLLMCMAATTSPKELAPTPSPDGTVDMNKVPEIVQALASRPVYEGPYEVVFGDPASKNDTDVPNSGKRVKRWVNERDFELLYICPYGQRISRITSYYDNYSATRRFGIECTNAVYDTPQCFLTDYVNNYDGPSTYTCPQNHVIAGMGGYHSSRYEDRRWQYWCCTGSGIGWNNCYWTNYVNWFHEYFDFRVPPCGYLTGISSYYDYEDRRFKFFICY